jgi:hypothetical protein
MKGKTEVKHEAVPFNNEVNSSRFRLELFSSCSFDSDSIGKVLESAEEIIASSSF